MAVEDELEKAAHVTQFLGLERRVPVDARVSARLEQPVPFPQWHLQRFPDRQQGLPARLRTARLDEAQMTGRQTRTMRQSELADASSRPPASQDPSERRYGAMRG